jgi:hypothetical protein
MRKLLAILILFGFFTSAALLAEDDKLSPAGGIDPSAIGNIHTDQDSNGNVRLKIDVKHLADPSKLVPPHHTYVAWVQPNGGQPQPVGEIHVNDKEEGSLTATTPAKSFDVFVTAEDTPNPTAPTGPVVLKGHVERT